jgi:hypothetical protein
MRKRFATSITRRSRVLCGTHDELERVVNVAFDTHGDTIVTLKCGAKRGELLSLRPGRVSLENVHTDQGRRLFPFAEAA